MDTTSKRPSYEESREYLHKNFENIIPEIPKQEDILPGFISKTHISDIIMTGKPTQQEEIAKREQDRLHASVLLWQAITNYKNISTETISKNEHITQKVALALQSKQQTKITLPSLKKIERDKDISMLKSLSTSDDKRKGAFMRFEDTIKTYLPTTYQEIVSTYANDVTTRLSMQTIRAELQRWDRPWSLLWEKVINRIE